MDNDYNPCLPMTINNDKRINIAFSSDITSFQDWFPSICNDDNDNDYVNEYMFDGARKWSIRNLIIEDYSVNNNDGYGVMRSGSYWFYGGIMCTDCSFTNITSSRSDRYPFQSYGSFHFRSSRFHQITANETIIKGEYSTTVIPREYVFTDCEITDVVLDSEGNNDTRSLIEIHPTFYDVK